jgi:uncharacterized membrane protein YkoI
MMMKTLQWWAIGAAIVLAAVVGGGTMVLAHEDDDDDDPALAVRLANSGEIRLLEPLRERALTERPGMLLKTELDHERGRYVYKVKILDHQGIVWKMKFDAKTGEPLRTVQDD